MKTDESLVCSEKTWQFVQTYIIMTKNKYNFSVFYRWINVLCFYGFWIKDLQSYFVIYFHHH
jgi:hypothetical protein